MPESIIPAELRERLERDDPELLRDFESLGESDQHCPACRGETSGPDWMDLCDGHLSGWITSTLAENDARRAAS